MKGLARPLVHRMATWWLHDPGKEKPQALANLGLPFGAGEMNRTPDLLITNDWMYGFKFIRNHTESLVEFNLINDLGGFLPLFSYGIIRLITENRLTSTLTSW